MSHQFNLEKAKHWNVKEWAREIKHINNEYLAELTPIASNHYDPIHWKEKLHTLIAEITEPSTLESIGKLVSLEQLHEILFWHSEEKQKISNDKVAAIFAGINPHLIYGIILRISDAQLSSLKQMAALPPIEYLLSLLSHEIKERFLKLCEKIEIQADIITNVQLSDLKTDQIEKLYQDIKLLRHEALEIMHICNASLAIVWNSNRTDTLQELSQTKELNIKCLLDVIGTEPECESLHDEEPIFTGFEKALAIKVDELFSFIAANGVLTKLHDDDPAIDALNIFSIWHLKDYHEIGLLKEASLSTIHELNSTRSLDSTLQKKQEALFCTVRKNLAQCGLATLKDLKRERIYSKQALIDFIALHLY